jgi:HK97 gp10 family phage protein
MMVADVSFSLTGLDSLLGKFEAVTYDVKRKGGRSALRKAAKMVAGFAKENALKIDDSQTGRSIAENIDLRWNGRLFKRAGDLGFRVGVRQGAKLPDKGDEVSFSGGAPTPHWRLIEFGFYNKRAGVNVAAQPFMRKALADHISEITNEFVSQYDRALDRAIKRAKKAGVK